MVTSCGVRRTLQGVRSILCHYPRWILLALVSDRREVEKDSSAPDAVYMTVRLEGATAPSSVFSSSPDGSNDKNMKYDLACESLRVTASDPSVG